MPTSTNNPSGGATEAWRRVVRGYEEAMKVNGIPENQRERLVRQLEMTREILGMESGAHEDDAVGYGFQRRSRRR
jgi:hypothetical protein